MSVQVCFPFFQRHWSAKSECYHISNCDKGMTSESERIEMGMHKERKRNSEPLKLFLCVAIITK